MNSTRGSAGLPGHCSINSRQSCIALIHQLVDGRIVRCDLLLDCTAAIGVLLGDTPQLSAPFLCGDDVGMRVAILRLSGGERRLCGGKRAVTFCRPATLHDKLPIFILK